LFDGLFQALAWPVAPERRHLIALFTDGFDTWSILDGEQLAALASHADVMLHAVVTASPPLAPTGGTSYGGTIRGGVLVEQRFSLRQSAERLSACRASQSALFDAVRRTGGLIHRLDDAVEGFESILADFRSSYVLRYTPRGVTREGWHEVDVNVTRRGSFSIRARKGYEGE